MNRSLKTVFLTIELALPGTGVQASEPPAPWELDEERARRLCDAMATYKPGPLATATEADRRLFSDKSASCMSFIYGDDEDRDYDQGRRCCLAHGDCNSELAMIFANGWGVPRDYAAATWFLCRAEAEGGGVLPPVALGGMLEAVQEMRTSGNPRDLDYCSRVTSGVGEARCEGLRMEAEAPKQERRIAAVADSLGSAARAALADLRRAMDAFAEADADLRSASSRGGTGHAAIFLSERREAFELFVRNLESFGEKRAPSATPAAFQDADRDLNAAYQAGKADLARPGDAFAAPGKPLPETLRDAQRAWLRHRDAWIDFYRLRWQGAAPPGALDREIRTALTRQRTAELRKLTGGE